MIEFITSHIRVCVICDDQVDTREEEEGGDPDGCEIDHGQWVCSHDCWDFAVWSEVNEKEADQWL